MMTTPGQRVRHSDFGEGVIVAVLDEAYVQVFFPAGERRIPVESLSPAQSREEEILANVAGTAERLRDAWLHVEAHELPLMDNATALTAARIDLLPHQVVLTHRIATAGPRRFLIADEVGLGKTIEVALVLRELASRGELTRALIVVPAGLVNNWHEELNSAFNLDFEVFGSEGDVTDRRSNAFARHDRLIASIDTLKRPARMKRLQEAPPWDLVVFDEAHHLSAYRNGRRVRRTKNYKLAEALRDHTRDLLLLSATPHQGDHFRFWMLVQLLNPTLFRGPEEMVDQRHRLNSVVFRRTKADACTADGDALFARRYVHTESFTMSAPEKEFYAKLQEYLMEGFDLAKRQGNQGRALGFVMTIFQKIAASSFAAVRSTLHRRQIMLTLKEAIVKDRELDVDGHAACLEEAKRFIREQMRLPDDPVGRGQADRAAADMKLRLIKKLDEEELAAAASAQSGEAVSAAGEELAVSAVGVALPEERHRIAELLAAFPNQQETKVEKLLRALGALWNQNSNERIVIFATYLATVDLLSEEIKHTYPGQGVVVLKGGDHGAKVAAERRFRRSDGPRVLICTAAGREGINLQFARVLFNFDLPWNPMDVEQRIGRIHRYGQKDTAQVYNLVLGDTIEGRIYLLLTNKLREIANALGKVDEYGNVTEDLRKQILGQLSERLSYDELYRNALSDPELKRTRQELEAAITSANEARKVVFDLFQDLDRFSLEEYRPLSNVDDSKRRLKDFLRIAVPALGGSFAAESADRCSIAWDQEHAPKTYTLHRDLAQQDENVELLGLDHPNVTALITRIAEFSPAGIGVSVNGAEAQPAILTVWQVQVYGNQTDSRCHIIPIGVTANGKRAPRLEESYRALLQSEPAPIQLTPAENRQLLKSTIEPALQREIKHRSLAAPDGGYTTKLICWTEIT